MSLDDLILTDEDRSAIHKMTVDLNGYEPNIAAAYRAGMKAGIERGAKEAHRFEMGEPGARVGMVCSERIRALAHGQREEG